MSNWWHESSVHGRSHAYWIKSLAAISVGVVLGHWLTEQDVGLPLRYQVSRLVQIFRPREYAQRTTLVLIADDEFWRGSLARRLPLRRDYLANLIRTVANCDPSAIAIDLKLRSPVITGALSDRFGTIRDNHDYTGETHQLEKAIMEISPQTPVVIPVSKSEDQTFVEPSVLDDLPSQPGHLMRGNISLPWDYRQVPTSELIGDRRVDSFALSTAATLRPELLSSFPPERDFPYDLAFIAPADFPTVYYREGSGFPNQQECWQKIRHHVVVVGSAWHTTAFKSGDLDDLRKDTPLGAVPAVYLHANYIEALLDNRAHAFIGDTTTATLEMISSAVIAWILGISTSSSADLSNRRRDPYRMLARLKAVFMRHHHLAKYVTALAMAALLLFLTYLFAQNFSLYADFVFPGTFVFLHAFWHDWGELKASERKLLTLEKELKELRRSRPQTGWS